MKHSRLPAILLPSSVGRKTHQEKPDQDPPEHLAKLADIILACGGAASLLALGYFVYYYSFTGQRQFVSSRGFLVYYAVPGILAIALFWSLWLRKTYKLNLALCLLSLGASLYAAETVLNIWSDLPSVHREQLIQARVQAAKKIGIHFDRRSKGQVVADLRSAGIDAVPSIFPAFLLGDLKNGYRKSVISVAGSEMLPLAAIANKKTVVCNEGGESLTYTSDEHGFNNPPNVWAIGRVDIAAIGDSYAQGWCVAPEKGFVNLLRGSDPDRTVLNLGIEGAGPLAMLATIKEYAAVVQPKIVLWFYFEGNDPLDLRKEKTSPLLMSYLTGESKQHLFRRQSEIDQALMEYIRTVGIEENSALLKLNETSSILRDVAGLPGRLEEILKVSEIRGRLGLIEGMVKSVAPGKAEGAQSSIEQQDRSMRPDLDLFHEAVKEARDTVDKWGGRLYFVYLPAWHRYAPGQQGQPDRDSIIQQVRGEGIPLIDVHEAFALHPDPLGFFPFRIDGHYNEEGHRVVAEQVLRALSSPTH
jgi:hypothetical protein